MKWAIYGHMYAFIYLYTHLLLALKIKLDKIANSLKLVVCVHTVEDGRILMCVRLIKPAQGGGGRCCLI